MSSLDISDEEVPATEVAEEPNITTNVEDVSDESTDEEPEVAASETVEEPEVAASETVEPEVAASETVEEPEVAASETVEPEVVEEPVEVKSSDNDLVNRVVELEKELKILKDFLSSKYIDLR